jgi:hypothetical protein
VFNLLRDLNHVIALTNANFNQKFIINELSVSESTISRELKKIVAIKEAISKISNNMEIYIHILGFTIQDIKELNMVVNTKIK